MSKTGMGLLVLCALAGAAQADIVPTIDIGEYTLDRATGAVSPAGGVGDATLERYRNWDGTSVLQGAFVTGSGTRNGDDYSMIAGPGPYLDSMGFNVYNGNAAGQRLTQVNGTLEFFDTGGALISAFTYNSNLSTLAGGGLDGQTSIRLSFAAGSLLSLGVIVPNAGFVTNTFTGSTFLAGGSAANLGLQVRNPPLTGTSTDQMIIAGAIVSSPFGGAPAGNTSHFITTSDVPAPGTLALLGMGGLIAGRRRR